jgi:hypothetical protein
LHADQIVASTNCVNVRFAGTGLEVDVVPVLYEGEAGDVGYLVSKDDGTRLKTSLRQHLDFIRGRKKTYPTHLAQLIRFTKWWARQRRRDGDFKCKSFMLELLWVHLLVIRLPGTPSAESVGAPWAVSVSFATDIAEDVDESLAHAVPDAYHLQARLPEPGRPALGGLPHAQAVIFQLRERLRTLRRSLRPPEIHLFLAMPGACALLLGNAWDRMPPTWTYWDLGAPGCYERAVRVGN